MATPTPAPAATSPATGQMVMTITPETRKAIAHEERAAKAMHILAFIFTIAFVAISIYLAYMYQQLITTVNNNNTPTSADLSQSQKNLAWADIAIGGALVIFMIVSLALSLRKKSWMHAMEATAVAPAPMKA